MSLHGKPIEVAVGTSLVVCPDSRSTMAGLELIHSFLSGEQDLAMTDTANDKTQKIWTWLGGSTASSYAMHWSRPLRPALFALYAVSRLGRSPLLDAFTLGSKPLCRIMDAIVARMPSSPFRQRPPLISEEELSAETLLTCMRDSSETHSFRTEYDRDSLRWLLDFMSRMKAYGKLRKVLLRNKERKVVGWYLYYLRKGGVGEVVQIGATHSSIDAVLGHLSYDAWTHGAIALNGRVEPQLPQKLSEKYCFFFLGNRLLVHSRNPELARLIQSDRAFLTRLDGEWCLRFGEPWPTTLRDVAGYRVGATDLVRTTRRMGHGLKTRDSGSSTQGDMTW
jgi:hypothetical protein